MKLWPWLLLVLLALGIGLYCLSRSESGRAPIDSRQTETEEPKPAPKVEVASRSQPSVSSERTTTGSRQSPIASPLLLVNVVGEGGDAPLRGGKVIAMIGEDPVPLLQRLDELWSASPSAAVVWIEATGFVGFQDSRLVLGAEALDLQVPLRMQLKPLRRLDVRIVGPGTDLLRRKLGGALDEEVRPWVSAFVGPDADSPPASRYVPRDLFEGQLVLLRQDAAFVAGLLGKRVFAQVPVPSTDSVTLTLGAAAVEGLFSANVELHLLDDASDQPMSGRYGVTPRRQRRPGTLLGLPATGVLVPGLPTCSLVLWAEADGYERKSVELLLEPYETRRVDVRLLPASQVLGSVCSSDGAIVKASVVAVQQEQEVGRSDFIADYMGEHFALDGLSPGDTVFHVVAPGWGVNGALRQDLDPGLTMGLRVPAAKGVEVVVDTGGSPLLVRVLQEGAWVWSLNSETTASLWLIPGEYELTFLENGHVVANRRVEVKEEAVHVRL